MDIYKWLLQHVSYVLLIPNIKQGWDMKNGENGINNVFREYIITLNACHKVLFTTL